MKSPIRRTLMKSVCLVSLTFQAAAYVQVYKYSRLGPPKDLYIASTAVCIGEVVKAALSFLLMVTFEKSLQDVVNFFHQSIVKNPLDTLRMCIPAIAFAMSTNLSLIAGANLDVITFQVIIQLKLPAAVFFAIVLLRSSFRIVQYLSVLIMMAGVILVQSTDVQPAASTEICHENAASQKLLSDKTLGIAAGLLSCVLAAFSNVYLEKILKSHESTAWSRNLQLSILSIPPVLVASFAKDWRQIQDKGFFHGYNYITWTFVGLQASGGMITALSLKLADNVSKSYATSCSIVLAGISSTIVFHYTFSHRSLCGAGLVVLSVPLYAITFKTGKEEPAKLDTEGQECYI